MYAKVPNHYALLPFFTRVSDTGLEHYMFSTPFGYFSFQSNLSQKVFKSWGHKENILQQKLKDIYLVSDTGLEPVASTMSM